ncbi:MAG: HAMP domain-containing histidine kinase [Chloroflexi bacterium]|nr:MAG: HAMP domain-containing histidine kinase [Chloroflexota bacterium]
MIHSLRGRLLVGMVLLVFAGLLIADASTYAALDSFLVSRLDDQLGNQGPNAAADLMGQSRDGPPGRIGSSQSSGGLPGGTYLAIYSADGRQLLKERTLNFQDTGTASTPTTTAKPSLPAKLPNAGPDKPTLIYTGGSDGTQFRVLVESIDGFGGDLIVVAIPLSDVQSTLRQLLTLEALIGSLVLLAIALLSLWIVRVGLIPLEKMGSTAAEIAAGDLTRRVSPATPRTEIGRLGLALNAMLSQIEEAFKERTRSEQRLKRFVADASHELRTPLTSIRGYAELMRRVGRMPKKDTELARRRIEEEAIRMSALVDDLLLLARLDQGRPLEAEPVNLQAIARDACADVAVTAPDRSLTLAAPTPVVVAGDDLRLRQVVGNLVRNAVVHTPPGTAVEVTVSSADGHARLAVVDHGAGLTPEERRRVFEPFFRADPNRSRDHGGSGLGLSIASAVVTAHGGKIEVAATAGGGATFSVELPLAGR